MTEASAFACRDQRPEEKRGERDREGLLEQLHVVQYEQRVGCEERRRCEAQSAVEEQPPGAIDRPATGDAERDLK